jgi:branched-chain amino acid transport system permease protein
MRWAEAAKEAGITAFLAMVLALPLVGFETVEQGSSLGIDTRMTWVPIVGAIVFAGRLLLVAWRRRRENAGPTALAQAMARFGDRFHDAIPILAVVAVAFAIAMPFMPFANRTVVDLGTLVLIYVMLGWGLNIVVGLAGLLDLGYVAFYAIGAYSFAMLAMHLDFSFWMALPFAGLFACSFGVILGFPVLRLRGDYLAIVTLGFGEMIRIILLNWYQVTGGPNGISNIPRPALFGLEFSRSGDATFHDFMGIEYSSMHRLIFLYYLILILALITNWVTLRLRRLPIGRAWEALREDEIACRALGLNPTAIKLSAFAMGAMFGGFAGAFFATRQGFISPESFTFIESAIILAIVVLGGMGSQVGVVVAAVFVIGLPEWFRDLQEYRMLFFGAAMVLVMVWRPRGLLSRRTPSIRLGSAEYGSAR